MIVCEREFAAPDPHYPQFSMCEVDVLSTKDYRLTVRKDIRNGKYQAYRSWFSEENKHKYANALAYQPRSFIQSSEGWEGFYDVEVVFESERLQEVLGYCNEQKIAWMKSRGWSESASAFHVDTVCPHTGSYRERAVGCRD